MFSQTRLHTIVIKGKVTTTDNKSFSGVIVDVLDQNNVSVRKTETNSSGNYELSLEEGKVFIVKFRKSGSVTKKVSIATTEITKDELKYGVFPLVIDIMLFDDFPGLDVTPYDKPVSKFSFSDYEGDFVYDEDYAKEMNKIQEKTLSSLKKLKKQAYDKFILSADKNYGSLLLEEAWLDYLDALSLLPEAEYPFQQIEHIKELLKKQADFEKAYNGNIVKADKNFDKENYKISKSYYKKSLLYKPGEEYPRDRISQIEKLLKDNTIFAQKIEQDLPASELADNTNLGNTTTVVSTVENKGQNQVVGVENSSKTAGIQQTSEKMIQVDTNLNDSKKEEYLNQLVENYAESGDLGNLAKAYLTLGVEYHDKNENDKAIENFKMAYDVFEKMGNVREQAMVAETMADIYFSMYRYTASSDWYSRANNLYSEVEDKQLSRETMIKSADASYSSGDLEQAVTRYMQALEILKQDSTADVSFLYNSIGVIHFEMNNFDEALRYFDLAIDISGDKRNNKEFSMSLNNIGNVRYEWKDYPGALQYYNRSIIIKNKIQYKAGIAVSLHNIANVFRKKGDNLKALEYYKKSDQYAVSSGNTDVIYENYGAMAEIYSAMKDCPNAIHYYKLYADNRHLITRKQGHDQINETSLYYNQILEGEDELALLKDEIRKQKMLSYYEAARKEKEIEYLSIQNELNKQQLSSRDYKVKAQRMMLIIAVSGFFLLILFSLLLLREYRSKKRANFLLAEQNEEINAQKQEIESQRDLLYDQKEKIEYIHHELTDSIRYAQRIQNAVLPSTEELLLQLQQYFIIFKPLELVSGDFFWSTKQGSKVVFCVADCTGHGVPGGFMSMLGISLLNEIVEKEKIIEPDLILNHLRENIVRSLGQKDLHHSGGLHVRDGMDIALCVFDITTNELRFAGANSPLYIIRNTAISSWPLAVSLNTPAASQEPMANSQLMEVKGDLSPGTVKLVEVKGDKMPVGLYEKDNPFTCHSIQMEKGDIVYLMSDGYSDQFGGEVRQEQGGTKFRSKQMKELLISISTYSLEEQKQVLEKTFMEWKGALNQVDDVTILGVKIG